MRRRPDFDQVTTRGGDDGDSTLFDGSRRPKNDAVFDALGDLDELNSYLGVVRSRNRQLWPAGLMDFDGIIREAQVVLARILALVACSPDAPQYRRLEPVDQGALDELEVQESRLLQKTTIEPHFVIPGDHDDSAGIDFARALCRRCERTLVVFVRHRPRPDLHDAQRYLNRLSDYLFVLARHVEQFPPG